MVEGEELPRPRPAKDPRHRSVHPLREVVARLQLRRHLRRRHRLVLREVLALSWSSGCPSSQRSPSCPPRTSGPFSRPKSAPERRTTRPNPSLEHQCFGPQITLLGRRAGHGRPHHRHPIEIALGDPLVGRPPRDAPPWASSPAASRRGGTTGAPRACRARLNSSLSL